MQANELYSGLKIPANDGSISEITKVERISKRVVIELSNGQMMQVPPNVLFSIV